MNESTWYKLLMGLFVTCFALLLVTGGGRLIGHHDPLILLDEEMPTEVCLASLQASIEQTKPAALRERESQRSDQHAHPNEILSAAKSPALCRDSNGNILVGCSYMRAVYQAFALGDGFV